VTGSEEECGQWVLSGSSAKKLTPKTVANNLGEIGIVWTAALTVR
jgi:hypothetical protein